MLITAMSTLGRLAAIAGLTSIVYMGCGTSHQFLPGMPLEKKEWMISVVWHYDMNRLVKPRSLVFPEVNAYIGIGKDYNFGFGAAWPFFVNHLSIARYYSETDENYWAGYFHLNGILSPYFNPHLEIGGLYSENNGGFRQNFSLGLAYGQGAIWNFGRPNARYYCASRGLTPVLKYGIYGKNTGLSWSHYYGQARLAIEASFPDLESNHDTVVFVRAHEVNSVRRIDDYGDVRCIFLSNGDSVILQARQFYGDELYIPEDEFQHWCRSEFNKYEIGDRWDHAWAIVNMDDVAARWEQGEDIVIMRYPQELVNRVKSLPSWKVDNSFGWAIMAFTDWK
ncbi:MAG: hypothetical protein JSU65_08515 [Candidatus Zixiibacteriota bacterium]|nr:MAG: hypothetical protein JSU65_08515 [candidate division Zixibacteria bacterium]